MLRGPRYTSGSHLGLGKNIDISRINTVTLKTKINILIFNTDVQLNCWLCFFVVFGFCTEPKLLR